MSPAHTDESDASPETASGPRLDDVRVALDSVTDPELDRSIVELDYVDEISLERRRNETHVSVWFTLPTAWCSPAFAWMMASDARDVVESMAGVARCEVTLRAHMHADEINEGVNDRLAFAEAFPDAEGGVDEIRATLDSKARLARQYDAVETLLTAGVTLEQVARLSRDDVEWLPGGDSVVVTVRDGTVGIVVRAAPLRRYLEQAATVGLYDDGDDRLFRTPDGEPIDPERAELVHRRARLASVNMSGQGGVCDALHRARQKELARGDD
jgi:metal-sulfur cluster biosynthetic enzyme